MSADCSSSVTRDNVIDFASGWVAGAAGVAVSQPLDTVLVRLQTARTEKADRAAAVARSLWAEGGPRAFWRGSTPMVWVVPLQNALLFAGYGKGVEWADDSAGGLLPVFAGGCVGGLAQSFVVAPVEFVKVRLQLPQVALRSELCPSGAVTATTVSVASSAFRDIGVPALWRGLCATFGRDVVPHGVWFATYEWSKQRLQRSNSDGLSPPLLAGALAAAVAWIVGYPFDLIKTRVQAANGPQPPTVRATAAGMLCEAHGNWRVAFFRGLGLKLCRAVPVSAVQFGVYEAVKSALRCA